MSALAWLEFERAILDATQGVTQITVLERNFVPLRVPTIEPILPEENSQLSQNAARRQFERRRDYYRSTLMLPYRGLVDLDAMESSDPWQSMTPRSELTLSRPLEEQVKCEDQSTMSPEHLSSILDVLCKDSRGFRFWHEVRVVLIESNTR